MSASRLSFSQHNIYIYIYNIQIENFIKNLFAVDCALNVLRAPVICKRICVSIPERKISIVVFVDAVQPIVVLILDMKGKCFNFIYANNSCIYQSVCFYLECIQMEKISLAFFVPNHRQILYSTEYFQHFSNIFYFR